MTDADLSKSLAHDELLRQLDYNQESGIFVWKINKKGGVNAGDIAGTKSKNGAVYISIWPTRFMAHRLAWLYVHKKWPSHEIDHINGNRSDNRIANLRDVTRLVNQQNIRVPHRDSKSQILGVRKFRNTNLYQARIGVKGKEIHIGYFKTPEEAHSAYLSTKRKLHLGNTL